ncbi:hypothetical protein ONE63_007049 [Megalurothrips usitatus]|uniref:Ig-like domain-containing protein n=1 Tax=Megalurothrips usitatus TaxID=439358 RepID=A0AAV7XU42_9NEOP|nr:hypothetical protein ONE63_007049 [Megalurothrips usitatus]
MSDAVPPVRVAGVYPVQIVQLHVPPYVSNGSHAAILDCEYSLGPRESINASGLVVKWFFNDGPAPVYQWIPPQKPQELGLLRGRLDLSYQVTKSDASRHRALYIRNPTTDLSGEWKCLVSTFDDEDFMTKKMVVYAHEKHFELTQSRPGHEESVNITCRAQGLFPEPKMALLRGGEDDNSRLRRAAVLPGVAVQTLARSGAYDIVATKLLDSEELSTPTILACELRVPHINYTRLKSLVYYPGKLNYPYSSESTGEYADSRLHFQRPGPQHAGTYCVFSARPLSPRGWWTLTREPF